jgi:fucose permease
MALGCSLMWPALWPLAIADLGRFTKAGSSLLVIAIVGGAVIPTIYGKIYINYKNGTAEIILPEKLKATFKYKGKSQVLSQGKQTIEMN